jgi:SAM-dependent methyltransferase
VELRDHNSIEGLRSFCRTLIEPYMAVVEIGSFGGESTRVFADFAHHVFAIDPWLEEYRSSIRDGCASDWVLEYLDDNPVPPMAQIEAIFDARVADRHNVSKLRIASREAVSLFAPASVDLVYIDSIHTGDAVRLHISEWRPKLRRGGIIAGHDYDPEIWPEVVNAVDDALCAPQYVFADTSWAVRLA